MSFSFLRREEKGEKDIPFPDGMLKRQSQRNSSLLIFSEKSCKDFRSCAK
jgi:hypothetical protein